MVPHREGEAPKLSGEAYCPAVASTSTLNGLEVGMLSCCPVCGKDALHELNPSKMCLGIEASLDLGVGGRWCICVKVSNLGKAE